MERYEMLEAIRGKLEDGDTSGAMEGLLDAVAALMDEVDVLNVQLESLLEGMADEEEDDHFSDECSYIVTCSACGCVMEVDSWLLEEEDAELSCPQCNAILEL
ncbi:MAG: hypothetical protein IIV43_05500 [Oscillospiraceae bacterium]|nr:hypothetical protein [Oscillospiraceae bacterium]